MATVHFGRLIGAVGFTRPVAIKRLHPQFANDPEFRAAITAYINWAVDTVALSHPDDADIPASLPLPHWSWDGLQQQHGQA